jgi:hypothetical protein
MGIYTKHDFGLHRATQLGLILSLGLKGQSKSTGRNNSGGFLPTCQHTYVSRHFFPGDVIMYVTFYIT